MRNELVRKCLKVLVLCSIASAAVGCAKPEGTTVAQKRDSVQDMRQDTLQKLYKDSPEAKGKIAQAAGYGVFSNIGMNLLVLASGNGYGVVRDNRSKEDVYMQMKELGFGLGLGAKDFYAVIVFHSPEALNAFVTEGWEWGGSADAAGKTGEGEGGSASGKAAIQKDMEVYLMTEKGFALQATASGTKYWRDDELNEPQVATAK